ncbi:MAG: SAM-dependent methyltransferase [Myxococcales bacterium]|nr:SAM-dependent methyltransferase [Myxococcales bacterium]|tara:strand:+ start:2327 stop:2860 length:534 start_codon:yes stop_codon:yes gene_type:complete
MAIWEISVFFAGLLIVGLILVDTLRSGISPMPSSRKAQKAMLSLMPESINGPVYELGSGWGQLALAVSHKFNSVPVIGYEMAVVPWCISRLWLFVSRNSNVTFRRADFRHRELGDAQMIVCYLFPGAMTHLAQQLKQELQPGSVIISNTFRLPGWEPEKVLELDDMHRSQIYRYIVQ